MAPPAPLGPGWRCHWCRRDGKALAGRVRRCCREAAAPPGTPFLGNDPRGASRLPPIRDQPATRRRVDSRPLTTGAGTDRDPKPEEFWSVPLSPCHGSRMARHQQEVRVDVVARWRPSEHRRFLALIPRGGRHVPSDWRRDDAVTGGPRATDRDAIPGEVSSGSGMMTAVARHRSEAPIYS